jgi:hypothetical protein
MTGVIEREKVDTDADMNTRRVSYEDEGRAG